MLAYDENTEEVTVDAVVPMVSGGELKLVSWVDSSKDFIVELYNSGKITTILREEEFKVS